MAEGYVRHTLHAQRIGGCIDGRLTEGCGACTGGRAGMLSRQGAGCDRHGLRCC